MKKIVLIFNHFEREHFGKDVFLFPYTLSKCVGGKAMIVYPETSSNKNFPSEYRNVTLKSLPFKGKESSWFLYREWNFLIFLIRKSKEIDILLRIHFTFMTALFVLLYKMINPKGITAVKLDGYLDPLFFSSDSLSLFKRLKHKVFFRTLRQVDLLTVETQCLYDRLYKEFIDVYDIKLKLVLMPNGFDEETLKTLSIVEKDFGHKENIMITVGRLGTYQKNTEMLLNALDLMELRDWKVYLIGSISEDLDFFLKDFFMRNPSKKESVFFVGPIYDKKSLWEFYNRAKVFILTSRFEGYPLVLTEAKRFRNYIVSTELDASEDLLENGKHGCLIAQENYKELLAGMKAGDFLIIGFGHNDEKNDPLRYTDPQTTFKENLRTFIDTARNAGAYPLLITPLYRRLFAEEGKLVDNTHLTYPQAMLEVGRECNVPVIDLCTMSRRKIEKAGDMDSRKWFMHLAPGEYPNFPDGKTDNTHLQYAGAVAFAELIAAGIAQALTP